MDTKFNYGRNALKAWTPENPNTNIPRAVYGDPNKNARTSDRFIERGDFFRLNNLQLGYNLPATVCGKLGISNLRFYVGGTRIFTITGYSGYDPLPTVVLTAWVTTMLHHLYAALSWPVLNSDFN